MHSLKDHNPTNTMRILQALYKSTAYISKYSTIFTSPPPLLNQMSATEDHGGIDPSLRFMLRLQSTFSNTHRTKF